MNIPSDVRLYDLAPSPNCIKARIGLNLKAVPFRKIAVDPKDRAAVVKSSGQPLTPVLLYGPAVVFDSHAILRWLDANVQQGPRLFSPDYATMKKIEEWEVFARSGLERSVRQMFGMAFGRIPVIDEAVAAANVAFAADSARLEEALAKGPWLVGGEVSAADVMLAANFYYASQPEHPTVRALPFWSVFQRFDLGPGRDRTRDWLARTMAWDCWLNDAARSAASSKAVKSSSSSRSSSKSSSKPSRRAASKPAKSSARKSSSRKPAAKRKSAPRRKAAKRSRR